jgi:DNA-binding transcriptional MocR family regulator
MTPLYPPLYRQLANHYLDALRTGTLAPGARFPSVRRLMRDHAVSLSTALQACRQLEDEGWLQARPRSGYFVQHPRRMALPRASEWPPTPPAQPLPVVDADYTGLNERISRVIALGEQHRVQVNLALAVADPSMYPAEALQRGLAGLLRREPRLLGQVFRQHGHPALQGSLARRLLARGVSVSPDEIITTHGCTEALNLALRAVAQPGDLVWVESPTFYGLLQILASLGLRAQEMPTSPSTGLQLDALAYALSQATELPKALLVMPNLHNPLGLVMPDAHKERLVRLCEQHGVALIEDDIYADMVDGDAALKPLKTWDRQGLVIHCSSASKVLLPGQRLGWMLAGRWQARVEMLKYTQSRYNDVMTQRMMAGFVDSPGFDRYLHRLRAALKKQREAMAEAVALHFPAGTRLSLPEGGLMLWLELPPQVNGEALFRAALAEGIKLAPGGMFSNSQRFDHFVRLSCGAAHTPAVQAALKRLGALAASMAS